MEIFSIKLKSVKNSNIFVVTSEIGDHLFHADMIVKYGIVGGNNDDEKFNIALNESAELIALEMANKYMASAIKTEKQLRDYLYKKEFKKSTIDKVVKKLEEYHIIDDFAYAEMYVKSNPNFSKNKIKQKLYLFGIKSEIIEEILSDHEDFEGCLINAQKFLKNKIIDKKIYEKLIRRLISQGYNYDTIKSVLNKLKFDVDLL